jgi:hypothetical protein
LRFAWNFPQFSLKSTPFHNKTNIPILGTMQCKSVQFREIIFLNWWWFCVVRLIFRVNNNNIYLTYLVSQYYSFHYFPGVIDWFPGDHYCSCIISVCYGVLCHFQQYFSYIVVVSFIGGGNWSTRRKPQTRRKSLTNFFNFNQKFNLLVLSFWPQIFYSSLKILFIDWLINFCLE